MRLALTARQTTTASVRCASMAAEALAWR